jgi:hypothetical protein
MDEPSIIQRADTIGVAVPCVSCDAILPVEAGQVVAYRRISQLRVLTDAGEHSAYRATIMLGGWLNSF